MRVLDSGHKYLLDSLDGGEPQELTFVKRDQPPEKYPGNVGHYPGTVVQEVCRALIDRLQYVRNQAEAVGDSASADEDQACVDRLRAVISVLEIRAARRHKRRLRLDGQNVETLPTCSTCGHIKPETHAH